MSQPEQRSTTINIEALVRTDRVEWARENTPEFPFARRLGDAARRLFFRIISREDPYVALEQSDAESWPTVGEVESIDFSDTPEI